MENSSAFKISSNGPHICALDARKYAAHLRKLWRQMDFPSYSYKKWTLTPIFLKENTYVVNILRVCVHSKFTRENRVNREFLILHHIRCLLVLLLLLVIICWCILFQLSVCQAKPHVWQSSKLGKFAELRKKNYFFSLIFKQQ